ncbi:conjugal transfer protein MobB [Tenacibaculum piscium]|uniref:conjugal transfer protein MobB n=1 Tax=Tenacibaculum piscium TaxID=1458515 RepID=UPI001F22F67C|nr:conjugal transfer protein MobB [Tenacibaculum piscium]
MIAKIERGNHLKGVLLYNYKKVEINRGNILLCHKMIEPFTEQFTIPLLKSSFEPYLIANNRTEKPILHISLNPNPKDTVSDELFSELAENYMQELGYGNQPFVVFKHTDTERAHIHIVSVCVDEYGKRISDSFERIRSMKICRNLEKKFGLTSAIGTSEKQEILPLQKVDTKQLNLKKQIASVLRFANENYHYQTMGEYKALLSFFNVAAEEVKGIIHGKEKRGLVYFATDDIGKKVSNPFKSSRFSGAVGIPDLQQKMEKSKVFIQKNKPQKRVRGLVREAMQKYKNQDDFRKHLQDNKVSLFVRENTEGRIYGVSFIDHHSKTVLNGTRLGKDLSANVFHRWWKEGEHPVPISKKEQFEQHFEKQIENEQIAEVQNFSNKHILEALVGLLPLDISEENDNQILKKKRKKKRYAKRR